MNIPEFNDIIEAHSRIRELIIRTPVLSSEGLNRISQSNLFFKCENFQKVGAFKYRGATNAVLQLDSEEARYGVVTHSSGNHAQALALAAKKRGIKAYIVMPDNSPQVKVNAVREYEGQVIFCKPTLEARESTANEVINRTNAKMIHPYDDYNIICGQGTSAKELIEEVGDLDFLIAPVGGGGLMSGTSISAKAMLPNVKVIGAEPKNADDAFRSLQSGSLQPSLNPNTIADGLRTSLSNLTFAIIQKNVDRIITVSEESIITAMRLIYERMKIVVEPSSATVLAVVLDNPEIFKAKKVGLILSGGNIDLEKLFS